jgi:hypothetical protein
MGSGSGEVFIVLRCDRFAYYAYPFVLSLSKDVASNLCFDRLSTNGFGTHLEIPLLTLAA